MKEGPLSLTQDLFLVMKEGPLSLTQDQFLAMKEGPLSLTQDLVQCKFIMGLDTTTDLMGILQFLIVTTTTLPTLTHTLIPLATLILMIGTPTSVVPTQATSTLTGFFIRPMGMVMATILLITILITFITATGTVIPLLTAVTTSSLISTITGWFSPSGMKHVTLVLMPAQWKGTALILK